MTIYQIYQTCPQIDIPHQTSLIQTSLQLPNDLSYKNKEIIYNPLLEQCNKLNQCNAFLRWISYLQNVTVVNMAPMTIELTNNQTLATSAGLQASTGLVANDWYFSHQLSPSGCLLPPSGCLPLQPVAFTALRYRYLDTFFVFSSITNFFIKSYPDIATIT